MALEKESQDYVTSLGSVIGISFEDDTIQGLSNIPRLDINGVLARAGIRSETTCSPKIQNVNPRNALILPLDTTQTSRFHGHFGSCQVELNIVKHPND